MNNQTKKKLSILAEKISKIQDEIDVIKMEVEGIKDIEENIYENMSEKVQESEKGENQQEYISILETTFDLLETASESTSEAMDNLKSILE